MSHSGEYSDSDINDCQQYQVHYNSSKIEDSTYKYDVAPSPSKGCNPVIPEADKSTYVWAYDNDGNEEMGLNAGTVVSNRTWSYGLTKYASVVQVGIVFKAKCTFTFFEGSTTRVLRMVDDCGFCHGEIAMNIHAGAPCVCAVPRKEKINVKSKAFRCAQPLSDQKPGNCGQKPPETEINIESEIVVDVDVTKEVKTSIKKSKVDSVRYGGLESESETEENGGVMLAK